MTAVLVAEDDPDRFHVGHIGPALEHHELFPEGTNIEFAQVESPESVRILIWERGVGPTFSSGTGSCAALVAAAKRGVKVKIIVPGEHMDAETVRRASRARSTRC